MKKKSNILIYTQPGCDACNAAKDFLKKNKQEYEEKVIGRHFSLDWFKSHFPEAETIPHILMKGKIIKYSDLFNLTFQGE